MDGQEKPTKRFMETPGVLPMQGGYLMGMCTTENGKVLLWAHDGNDEAVQKYIEQSWLKDVPKRAVTMYILDVDAFKKSQVDSGEPTR